MENAGEGRADPFDAQTERQVLVAIAVAGALVVWRLQLRPDGKE